MTGIADLQVEFEEHQATKDWKKKRSGMVREKSKQNSADEKHLRNKMFRGKVSGELTSEEKQKFKARKARSRRVEFGLEGVSHKVLRQQREGALNLPAALRRFLRTGKVPKVSVDVIREADSSGVDSESLKLMIRAMLIRGGIEENPGPRTKKEKEKFDGKKWVVKNSTSVSTSTSSDEKKVVPTSSKSDSESVDVTQFDGLESRESDALARQREKEARCAGNQPDEAKRKRDKTHRSRKNFSKDSLLSKANFIEASRQAGKEAADVEKEKDDADDDLESCHEEIATVRKSFIMRSGGFARPWYVGFGTPTTRVKMFAALMLYLPMWWRWFMHGMKLPLWNPRLSHEGKNFWSPYVEEDEEKFTPVFKGIVFSVVLCLTMSGIIAVFGAFTWICTIGNVTGWAAWGISIFAETTASIQLFSLAFRPIQRYQGNDVMMEVSKATPRKSDPYFSSCLRPAGQRFRAATDDSVLADVSVRQISVHDSTKWYAQYWRTSWLLGSLYTWLECNRLMKLVDQTDDYVISLRLADNIAYALCRARMSSYEDCLTKARAIASNYDELKLGVHPVDGRNVREDTVRYAAALHWSSAAGDGSFLNESSPHSD